MKRQLTAMTLAFVLADCAAQSTKTPQPQVAAPAEQLTQRDLVDGLYEMALSPKGDTLYVSSAEGFKDVQGGMVYKLDPKTLKTLGASHTDLKNFGMTISDDGQTVYVAASVR